MEVMRKLAGCVSLVLCMCGLRAELNVQLYPPAPEYFKAPCVFPFTYNDLTYYSCISVHSDYAWCSLEDRFNGRWRYCTANDPPMCTFPFRFRSRLFQTCTKIGYIFNRTWCSLTSNYDADRKWKQCSPYNL